jgi:hypothetical protein
VQLGGSGQIKIVVTKSCCPVCWQIAVIFKRENEKTPEQGSESGNYSFPVHFDARGRHPNLYPVDLPDILDETIKDELLKKFRIILLRNLASLGEEAKAAKSKHMRSESNVSQPESLAFSMNSSLCGSIDISTSRVGHASLRKNRQEMLADVESWRTRNSSCIPEEPLK